MFCLLSFLPPLANFGSITLIPIGIRVLGTEREKRWKIRVSYFLFLSCLWKDGRLIGSNLYPAAEGDNLGIWTCGYLDLLPFPLLFSTNHSIVRASCLIISFFLCLIEFRVPSNSPWAK